MSFTKLGLLSTLVLTLAGRLQAQEFKPHPQANITSLQWLIYFNEVFKKHSASVQALDDQKLTVYTDAATNTVYSFTQPEHAAHPAWIARKPEQRVGEVVINQIGYFAGSEPAFAKLFKDYLAANETTKQILKNQSLKAEGPAPQTTSAQPLQVTAPSNFDPTWRPSQLQTEQVKIITEAYFSARDSNQSEMAYRFLGEGLKSKISFAIFKNLISDFNEKAGQLVNRQIQTVTWYRDTPQQAGLFAAVNFGGNFSKLAMHCGYVLWQQQSDGSFLQVREENNVLDKTTAAKLSQVELDSIKAQYKCIDKR